MRRGTAVPRSDCRRPRPATVTLFGTRSRPADVADESVTLSTGETVPLPLETRARMAGVVLTADASRVRERLPDALAPVRIAPGRAAVTVLSVVYDRIGDGALAPYREAGVLLAATPADGAVPELDGLRRELWARGLGIGGYVLALPVTTEPARALGEEVWGYPKTVADVSVAERDGRRRTTVSDSRGRLFTVESPVAPRVPAETRSASFTDDGGLRRQPLRLDGRFGVRPLAGALSLGDHPVGERLAALSIGRSLLSVSFEGAFTIEPGERLPP